MRTCPIVAIFTTAGMTCSSMGASVGRGWLSMAVGNAAGATQDRLRPSSNPAQYRHRLQVKWFMEIFLVELRESEVLNGRYDVVLR